MLAQSQLLVVTGEQLVSELLNKIPSSGAEPKTHQPDSFIHARELSLELRFSRRLRRLSPPGMTACNEPNHKATSATVEMPDQRRCCFGRVQILLTSAMPFNASTM